MSGEKGEALKARRDRSQLGMFGSHAHQCASVETEKRLTLRSRHAIVVLFSSLNSVCTRLRSCSALGLAFMSASWPGLSRYGRVDQPAQLQGPCRGRVESTHRTSRGEANQPSRSINLLTPSLLPLNLIQRLVTSYRLILSKGN